MRLFIAVPVPPDIRRAAADTDRKLRAYGATGRFVPGGNYHITMHYIGESNDLVEAAEAMHEAAHDARPFLLRLTDYGTFSSGTGRTGYIGVSDETGELARLYEVLEDALWDRGFTRNRTRLVPHITLGRNISGDEGFSCPRREAFTANALVLYESRAVRGGIEYVPVHKERIE
ncbi:MAG: RNA 2',3'-cyclic phosphodiesterase [Clostridia bacterium]|nr:RNA 2',3'-cyclic phosphodiesterase [Clostridia bacterium]